MTYARCASVSIFTEHAFVPAKYSVCVRVCVCVCAECRHESVLQYAVDRRWMQPASERAPL